MHFEAVVQELLHCVSEKEDHPQRNGQFLFKFELSKGSVQTKSSLVRNTSIK